MLHGFKIIFHDGKSCTCKEEVFVAHNLKEAKEDFKFLYGRGY